MWLQPAVEALVLLGGGGVGAWFLTRNQGGPVRADDAALGRELAGAVMAQVLMPGPAEPDGEPRAGAGVAAGEAFARVWAQAEQVGWARLVAAGVLVPVSAPVIDPGNPVGSRLALVEHITGAFGDVRVLLAVNACPDGNGLHELIAIPVPPYFTDPLAAAAWTYDDPDHPIATTAVAYARLVRRT